MLTHRAYASYFPKEWLLTLRNLGVDTNDKIAFEITSTGDVLLTRFPTLAELQGSLGTLPKKLSWKEMQEIAREYHVEEIMREG